MAQLGRVALATRSAALSGSHIKAPGFAGGYLTGSPGEPAAGMFRAWHGKTGSEPPNVLAGKPGRKGRGLRSTLSSGSSGKAGRKTTSS